MNILINGEDYNLPRDEDGSLKFNIDFSDDVGAIQFSLNSIQLYGENKAQYLAYRDTYGAYVAMPATVNIGGQDIQMILNPLLEYQETEEYVSIGMEARYNPSNFMDNARDLIFDVVDFQDSDFRQAKYVVVPNDRGVKLITLGLAAFNMAFALASATQLLVDATIALVQAAATILKEPADFIAAAAKFLAVAAYFAATLAAAFQLGVQFKEVIFPAVREHKCIDLYTLCLRSCERLGFTFESELLGTKLRNWTIVPVPLLPTTKNIFEEAFSANIPYTNGYPSVNDVTPDFGSLIDVMKRLFNMKISVLNNKVRFEDENYFINTATVKLNNYLELQDEKLNARTHNWGNSYRRVDVSVAYDPSDYHSLTDTKRLNYEVFQEPNNLPDPTLNLVKGGVNQIRSPFARGTRKEKLTFVETAARDVLQSIDNFVNFVGGNSSLANNINDRIGVMQISQDYYATTKLLFLEDGRQPEDYRELIGASYIYNNFHKYREINNYFRDVVNVQMPFNEQDFVSLVNLPYAIMDGDTVEIVDGGFETDYAEQNGSGIATFRLKKPTTVNAKVNSKVIYDGQGI